MRALVVADSPTMRRIVSNTLGRMGHRDIVEAANGHDGLERLTEGSVDLVITDWSVTGMSGVEFVRSLRGMERGSRLPVLMLTSNVTQDDILVALRAGVDEYVVKPFTPETLTDKIDAVLAQG
jgi:two-component system, chemotaxis family, chemotaxis protein CheY